MRNNNVLHDNFKKNLPFFLLTLLVFMIEARPLVMHGMFFDGVAYFSIALDMATHTKALWLPYFEHPPLAMFLQSLLFRLLGTSMYVDKLYSFILVVLNITAVVLLWKRTSLSSLTKAYFLWIPVLIWLLIFGNFSDIRAGFLEPSLTVFTSFASLFAIMGIHSKQGRWLFAAGLFIAIAFFINGLQAFFPLAIPIIYWLVFQPHAFFTSLKQTLFLTFYVGALIFFSFLYPPIYHNMTNYFHQQLWPSLSGIRAGKNTGLGHLHGLWTITIHQFSCMIGITFAILIIEAKKCRLFSISIIPDTNRKWALFFFLVGLSASVPILINSRQNDHYFYQGYPFFVLMFSHMISPIIEKWIRRIKLQHNLLRWTIALLASGCIIASAILLGSIGKIGRDKLLLTDILRMEKIIPTGATISISREPEINFRLIYYLYRYCQVSPDFTLGQHYYLQPKNALNHPAGYQLIKTPLESFDLFEKETQ